MIDLCGLWALEEAAGGHGAPLHLPGDVISALHDAGAICDPYWGRNEYDLRWIAERDWVARRSFTLDRTDVELLCEGLDGIVSVRVNGTEVLRADNAFRTWRADLSGVARIGENEIELRFHSVVAEAARRAGEQPFFIPYVAQNNPIPYGNMIRKPGCDFGWDWNIALAPFGVTGGIAIRPHAKARLDHVMVSQAHVPGAATVTVTAHIAGDAEGDLVEIMFGGRRIEAKVKGRVARAEIRVDNPELWWPAGQGMQPLYDLEVRLGEDVQHRRIGLRQIELTTPRDSAGVGFTIRVNGRDIFCKGANWIPADALSGRITEAGVADLLRSAVDAHMNMIRVWGGGRYEPDYFYDLCDELGLLVWQDFMFACNLYPSGDAFLQNVRAEARENIRRLHHHAALALWCGDNELIGALTWYEESRADRDRYLVNYDRLNRALEETLREVDPGAIWWPSSPSPGPLSFGDAWHDDSAGDMHFWSVWHENRDFAHYRDVKPRFCSEFGFQSYPSMAVIRRFADPSDFNIAAPVLESHQKNEGGNERIAATMFRYFRFPVDFENFVYLSQVQQGIAIQTAVSAWRALRPHCMGTLYWQLNDTWPCASWSSLDHGGGWKLLHHMARRFYAPVFVTAEPQGDRIRLIAVNDLPEGEEVVLWAEAVGMDGARRALGTGAAKIGGRAETLLEIGADELAPGEVLHYSWSGAQGTRADEIFAPRPWKAYDLRDPGLRHEISRDGADHVLTLSAQAPAFFVAGEASVAGRWSGGAVHVLPGAERRLTFTPDDPAAEVRFTLRNLYAATYGEPQ